MNTNADYRHVENTQETMIEKFEALTSEKQDEMIAKLRHLAIIGTLEQEKDANWKRYSNSPK